MTPLPVENDNESDGDHEAAACLSENGSRRSHCEPMIYRRTVAASATSRLVFSRVCDTAGKLFAIAQIFNKAIGTRACEIFHNCVGCVDASLTRFFTFD